MNLITCIYIAFISNLRMKDLFWFRIWLLQLIMVRSVWLLQSNVVGSVWQQKFAYNYMYQEAECSSDFLHFFLSPMCMCVWYVFLCMDMYIWRHEVDAESLLWSLSTLYTETGSLGWAQSLLTDSLLVNLFHWSFLYILRTHPSFTSVLSIQTLVLMLAQERF